MQINFNINFNSTFTEKDSKIEKVSHSHNFHLTCHVHITNLERWGSSFLTLSDKIRAKPFQATLPLLGNGYGNQMTKWELATETRTRINENKAQNILVHNYWRICFMPLIKHLNYRSQLLHSKILILLPPIPSEANYSRIHTVLGEKKGNIILLGGILWLSNFEFVKGLMLLPVLFQEMVTLDTTSQTNNTKT